MFIFFVRIIKGKELRDSNKPSGARPTHPCTSLVLLFELERTGDNMETERTVEQALKRMVEKAGGCCYKFTSPSRAGVPDRIVVLRGRVVFVELKATGEKPRALQKAVAKTIRKAGGRVYCLSSVEQVMSFVQTLKRRYPVEEDYDNI